MRERRRVLLPVAALALLTGCASNMIRVQAIDGALYRVLDRHDDYVRADDDLSELERSTYLRSSTLLREVVAEAKR